ncbi:MAG: hypothetical protein GYB68_02390, partial [Chloroflexi bacterium]|nr:hypothetical protein [Chloroflexota bacterium]
MSVLQVAVYAFTLWMGLYMLERAWHKPGMRYAGLGLLIYAIGLASVSLADSAGQRVTWQPYVALLTVPLWALALPNLHQMAQTISKTRRVLILAYLGAAFFLMTTMMILIPQHILANTDLLVALSIDLVLMGFAIAWINARDDGEALLPDALRSLLLAGGGCLIFGGQIALILLVQAESSAAFRLLLFETLTSVIILVVFSRQIAAAVDGIVYRSAPDLRVSRAALRDAATQVARSDPSLSLATIDNEEFDRLTRRTLSNMNHPQRLVASPLMKLPFLAVDDELGSLERAQRLRETLAESIMKLKPSHDEAKGITEEWRHFNA